jgi:hypothetical protein
MSNDKRELLFTIDDFEVYSNSVYVIEGKPDYTAPSGFIAKGVTALPSADIDKTYPGPFIESSPGSTEGIWDTGFYPMSPCYAMLDEKERTIIANARKKNILNRYKTLVGDADALDHTDHKGWNKFSFTLKLDKLYNTSNPKDLMELYMAIHIGVLCPKGKERNHRYSKAAYTIVDKARQSDTRKTAELSIFEAIETFSLLWQNDQARLKDVLTYINIKFSDNISKADLVSVFSAYIKGGQDKIEVFVNTIEKSEKPEGYTEIKLFKNLSALSKKGASKLTRSPNGVYFYDSFEVGPDLKAAAKNITMNKEFLHIKNELVHLTDED